MAQENLKISQETIKQAGVLLRQEHERAEKLAADLKKEAEGREREKRASRIAFREVELGVAEPFRSYEEYQKKVASLVADPELEVIEKALERGYTGTRREGELVGTSVPAGTNPLDHYLRTGELNI